MTNTKSPSKWSAFRKLLLILPFLAVLIAVVPNADARDHDRDRREYRRHDYRHGDHRDYRRRDRGYYHDGRYYRNRRYYYRNGRRSYRYYDILPAGGVYINLGL